MVEISQEIIDLINTPQRIGILSTVDSEGQPNSAFFGSPRFRDNNQIISMGVMGGRTLANLKTNPKAVLFCLESSPVGFDTPSARLYLKAKTIETEGDLLQKIKAEVAKNVNQNAADMMSVAITFEIVEVRKLVDFD